VLESLTRCITPRLKLVVNEAKSAGARAWERQLRGLRWTRHRAPTGRLAPQAVQRFKTRIRTLTQRPRGRRLETLVAQGTSARRGWHGDLGWCQPPAVVGEVDAWRRRRLRRSVWKQGGRTGERACRRRGVRRTLAWHTANAAHGPGRLRQRPALRLALPAAGVAWRGLLRLAAPP
jgi:RNA-directed DNA polymerase